ncbi:hypothetical protein Mp_8g02590 [Marchantia polymorpha subsp. ruderalis]|nr:hypothetical protein Mp_8g02590 [Marchantia polymorpha subsp. ruderalis]
MCKSLCPKFVRSIRSDDLFSQVIYTSHVALVLFSFGEESLALSLGFPGNSASAPTSHTVLLPDANDLYDTVTIFWNCFLKGIEYFPETVLEREAIVPYKSGDPNP